MIPTEYFLILTVILAVTGISVLAYGNKRKQKSITPKVEANQPDPPMEKEPPKWIPQIPKHSIPPPAVLEAAYSQDEPIDTPNVKSPATLMQPKTRWNFKEEMQKEILRQMRDKELLLEMEPVDDQRKGGVDIGLDQKFLIKFKSREEPVLPELPKTEETPQEPNATEQGE